MPEVTVRDALVEGREAVAHALALGATTGPEPDEETLSWLLQSTAAWTSDRVVVRRFTRHEENRFTGADWLWWWEGDDDGWFGCLVQAKRLFGDPQGPTFAYDYRPAARAPGVTALPQIDRLLEASDMLRVPAAYVLYRSPVLGPPQVWRCATVEPTLATAAVTYLAAAIVKEWLVHDEHADLSVVRPVECLTCPGQCGDDLGFLTWYSANLADPNVRQILRAPPTSTARRAFRALFAEVVRLRATQFRSVSPDVYDQLHSGLQLGQHFARGFREPPAYVRAIATGEPFQVPIDEPELQDVAGVAVFLDR